MLKKLSIAVVLLLTLCTFTVNAQIRKIPAEVTKAFNDKFPDAKNVEWSDKITSFKVDFSNGKVATSAWFSAKGEWKETEEYISTKEIPSVVKSGLSKSKYANWTVKEVSRIFKPDNSEVYKVSVAGTSIIEKKNLYFSTKGQLLKDAQTL